MKSGLTSCSKVSRSQLATVAPVSARTDAVRGTPVAAAGRLLDEAVDAALAAAPTPDLGGGATTAELAAAAFERFAAFTR